MRANLIGLQSADSVILTLVMKRRGKTEKNSQIKLTEDKMNIQIKFLTTSSELLGIKKQRNKTKRTKEGRKSNGALNVSSNRLTDLAGTATDGMGETTMKSVAGQAGRRAEAEGEEGGREGAMDARGKSTSA